MLKKHFYGIFFLVMIFLSLSYLIQIGTIVAKPNTGQSSNYLAMTPTIGIDKSLPKIIYSTHLPLDIENNSEFGVLGLPGSGTQADPYIINGYTINQPAGALVFISSTTKYVIISNCLLNGSGLASIGVKIFNSSHITFKNDYIAGNAYGMVITTNTSNVLLINNTFDLSPTDLSVAYTNLVTIMNNTFSSASGSGLSFRSENYNTLISYNTFINNYNSVEITPSTGGSNVSINNNIIISSIQTGVLYNDIYSYTPYSNFTITDNLIKNSNIGIETNSVYIVLNITHNTIKEVQYGIYMINSSAVLIIDNQIVDNHNFGIYLEKSSKNLFLMNNITNIGANIYEVYLNASSKNTFRQNIFLRTIHSIFSQAFDDGTGTTFIYNYWSEWVVPDINHDGIVDYPYFIDGSAQNKDMYPLVHIPSLNGSIFGSNTTSISSSNKGGSTPGWTITLLILPLICLVIWRKNKQNK